MRGVLIDDDEPVLDLNEDVGVVQLPVQRLVAGQLFGLRRPVQNGRRPGFVARPRRTRDAVRCDRTRSRIGAFAVFRRRRMSPTPEQMLSHTETVERRARALTGLADGGPLRWMRRFRPGLEDRCRALRAR